MRTIIICLVCFIVNLSVQGQVKLIKLNQGATSQSSDAHGGHSSRAADGNTSGQWGHKSVSHTNLEEEPWWEINLGKDYIVTRVEVYNRTDCCMERLDGIEVQIRDRERENTWRLSSKRYDYRNDKSNPVVFTGERKGRIVRIKKYIPGYLSLAEVKVYGKEVDQETVKSYKVQFINESSWDLRIEAYYGDDNPEAGVNAVDANKNPTFTYRQEDNYGRKLTHFRVSWIDAFSGKFLENLVWADANQCWKATGTIFNSSKPKMEKCY